MSSCDTVGYLASTLVFMAFCMKAMIPLRIVALCSNLAFIAYGLELHLTPVLLLHFVLLPVNAWRLWQAIRPQASGCLAELHLASSARPQGQVGQGDRTAALLGS